MARNSHSRFSLYFHISGYNWKHCCVLQKECRMIRKNRVWDQEICRNLHLFFIVSVLWINKQWKVKVGAFWESAKHLDWAPPGSIRRHFKWWIRGKKNSRPSLIMGLIGLHFKICYNNGAEKRTASFHCTETCQRKTSRDLCGDTF